MTRAAWFFSILCLVAVALMPAAFAAPVRLAKYEFVVSGQEAVTGDFAIPAGKNRTIIITVHARTDTGTTQDYVTVDWARLDGDSAQGLTKGREAFRVHSTDKRQGTTLLYRHIDNSVSGDHNVLIRMANNLTEAKVVHVHVMGNIDSSYNPVSGDVNGNQGAGAGNQAIVGQAADTDFVVMDAATHNSSTASVTGRAPAAKTYLAFNNTPPSIKALTAFHPKTTSGSANYSYTMNVSDAWSIVTVRFRAAYTIVASAGANGTITPSGDVPVLSGGSQSFDIDADTNYVIAQLLVDGTPVAAAAGLETYTYSLFTNVTADHTIAATFSGRPILTVDPATEDFECTTTGYTEAMAMAGVDAQDPEDGDITGDVVMSNVTFPLIAPGVYTILYDVSDSDNTPAVQQQRVVTIADTLNPVLTLNGESELTLECGVDEYVELDADAADQCDGDLTDDVVIGGETVDELVTDTYVITYDVVDNEGLTDSATRTVHVVDTTGPEITLLAASNPLVLDGGASYAEAGATAWDACEGDILPVIIDNTAVNTSAIGSYAVPYTAEDGVGNVNTEILTVLVQRQTCQLLVNAVATTVMVAPGETATLAVELDPASCEIGQVSYGWMKNTGSGFEVLPSALNSPSLVITGASQEDAGVYRCEVSDEMYSVNSPDITLTVSTGLPVAGLAGIAALAALATLSGAVVLRKRVK